jgi:chemotaxis-related protein WspD
VSAAQLNDCWKHIGVYGDSSCPQLAPVIHCRNCPVYAAAAVRLLDIDAPAEYVQRWTAQVAAPLPLPVHDTHSVVIFRLATEWLALPASIFKEIAAHRAIHSLPHRRNGALLGLTNIRGQLLVCTSLQSILGIDHASPMHGGRMLVLQHNAQASVCPVDEVHGVERFQDSELRAAPATFVKAAATYIRAVWVWRQRFVGVLDEELLFHTINRSFQSATSI